MDKKIVTGLAVGAGVLVALLTAAKKTNGDGTDVFICPYCGAEFDSQQELEEHMVIHSTTNYPCPYCDATFETEQQLADHIAAEHQQTTYDCSYCNWTFDTPEELAQHIAEEHATVLPGIVTKISSTTTDSAIVNNDVLVKVLVSNPNNSNIETTIDIAISPDTYSFVTEHPLTLIIPANSSKSFGFKVKFTAVGIYSISAGDIVYQLTINSGSTNPNTGDTLLKEWTTDSSRYFGSDGETLAPNYMDSLYQGVKYHVELVSPGTIWYESAGLMGEGTSRYVYQSEEPTWFQELLNYANNEYQRQLNAHGRGTFYYYMWWQNTGVVQSAYKLVVQ